MKQDVTKTRAVGEPSMQHQFMLSKIRTISEMEVVRDVVSGVLAVAVSVSDQQLP